MNVTTLTLTALAIASLNLGFAQDHESASKSKAKIIIRTHNNGDEDEMVIEADGKDAHDVLQQIDKRIQATDLAALWAQDGLDDIDIDLNLASEDSRFPGFLNFGGGSFSKPSSFDDHWRHVAKALKRSGIDEETIARVRSLAKAYADPHKRHMIGVQCEKLSGVVRSQLGLESGLAVQKVYEDSPAKEAGVKKHDILLKVDDEALRSVNDLVDAVQASGTEDATLTLTLLRQGEEHTLRVTPKPQKEAPMTPQDIFGGFGGGELHLPGGLAPQPVPPSLPKPPRADALFGSDSRHETVEDLEETIAELKETIGDLKERIDHSADDDHH